MLGFDATQAEIDALRRHLGLDRPLGTQFVLWLGNVLRGNLGTSLFLDKPVVSVIVERLEPTLLLTLYALLIAVLLGVPAGVISAIKRNGLLDQVVMFLALMGLSIPDFWLALLLILGFAVGLRWLPAAGYQPLSSGFSANFRYLILPSLSVGLGQAAYIARMTRTSMIDVITRDYIRTARAKGLAEWCIVGKHALKNALIPVITVAGMSFAIVMGGAATIAETIFTIPGVGRLVVSSIQRRDYPVIQGTIMFIACVYLLTNLIIDILYAWIDPRIRYD
jgi:peptide/nickel transport system permease protein